MNYTMICIRKWRMYRQQRGNVILQAPSYQQVFCEEFPDRMCLEDGMQ